MRADPAVVGRELLTLDPSGGCASRRAFVVGTCRSLLALLDDDRSRSSPGELGNPLPASIVAPCVTIASDEDDGHGLPRALERSGRRGAFWLDLVSAVETTGRQSA